MTNRLDDRSNKAKDETPLGKAVYTPPVLRFLGLVAALTTGGSGTKKDGRNVSKKN